MIKRYSCGCFSSFDQEKLCNAVHVNYPCFKHKRGKDVGNTIIYRKVEVVKFSVKQVPVVKR